MKISEWLTYDPVALDITRKKNNLKVDKNVFELLISKLRAHHPDYFRDALGLKTKITFKGYNYPVAASIPYSAKPIEFYKWWCLNQDAVNMTLEERVRLFDKVYNANKAILKIEHLRLINKR